MEVAERQCNECLFCSSRIVTDERAAEIIRDCAKRDTHFICHKFTLEDGRSQVMCRGHYEAAIAGRLPTPRLLAFAQWIGAVQFVPLPLRRKQKAE